MALSEETLLNVTIIPAACLVVIFLSIFACFGVRVSAKREEQERIEERRRAREKEKELARLKEMGRKEKEGAEETNNGSRTESRIGRQRTLKKQSNGVSNHAYDSNYHDNANKDELSNNTIINVQNEKQPTLRSSILHSQDCNSNDSAAANGECRTDSHQSIEVTINDENGSFHSNTNHSPPAVDSS